MYPLYSEGKLDPQAEALLNQIAKSNSKPLSELTPQQARAGFLEPSWLGTVEKGVHIKGMTMPGPGGAIPICIYTPAGSRPLPLLAKDLSRLPPALVISAEFDVLHDEGEAYAQRLRAAGVAVQCRRYDGMLHDFVTLLGMFSRAQVAIDEIFAALRVVLHA